MGVFNRAIVVVMVLACALATLSACGSDAVGERIAPTAKVRFFIGLGDAAGPSAPGLSLTIPNDDGTADTYRFDQAAAEAQRQDAIKYGRGREGGYEDRRFYQLKDIRGRPLPVFWKPWARGAGVDRDGDWVYVPDHWYRGRAGFTEQDVKWAALADSGVVLRLKPARREAFEAFTAEFVGRSLCLVVNDHLWSNPTIQSPITADSVEISVPGGSSGGLLDALGRR